MDKISSVFLGLLLLTLIQANDKYQPTQTIEAIGNKNKVAFSHDDSWMLAYSESQAQVDMYSTFNFKKIFSIQIGNVTYVQFFEDALSKKAFVSGDINGNIYYTKFTDNEREGFVNFRLNPLELPVIKVIPNSHRNLYAAICEGSTKVYISALTQSQIFYTVEFNTSINSLKWHPSDDQIAVALEPNDKYTAKLIIYDINKKTWTDISQNINETILDLQYSEDGLRIAYIIKDNTTDIQTPGAFITIININTQKIQDWLVAPEANQLIGLQREGKLLTAFDSSNSYVWQFDNSYFGKYQTNLKNIGLSRTASYLITIDPLSPQMLVYKFCTNPQTCFLNQLLICGLCEGNCLTCFKQQKRCSSCTAGYFLNYDDYTCSPCSTNCKSCIDADTCQTCISGYYVLNNKCEACSLGCTYCIDKDNCSFCDQQNHWTLNDKTNQCECQFRYYLNGDQCDPCIKGCFSCLNGNQCNVCDGSIHRILKPQDKTCVCDVRYFQDNNQCKSCLKGCFECENIDECKTCDGGSHWFPHQNICVCDSGFTEVTSQCQACSVSLQGCISCLTVDICLTCLQDYTLDVATSRCNKNEDSLSPAVIILVIAACLVIIGVASFFIVKIIKKRKGKKVETLLQDQQEMDQANS